MSRCIGPRCTARAVHLHHVITRQELKKWGGDPDDPRAVVPLCWVTHERHHSRAEPLPLSVLPDEAFEFALEVMGAGPAHAYLTRYYDGWDDRLALLLGMAS